jgi:uncharacterized protein (DUF302 family)
MNTSSIWPLKILITQSGEKGRTTTTITPIRRKQEYENEKKGSYLIKFKKSK